MRRRPSSFSRDTTKFLLDKANTEWFKAQNAQVKGNVTTQKTHEQRRRKLYARMKLEERL